ncbi:Uncharacterized protein SCF082_LOCUS28424, partial [Durusdinium trenchii]
AEQKEQRASSSELAQRGFGAAATAGCGKTELSKRFEGAGFDVLDEAFLDMPSYGLHPQSLLMETTWICSWFERLLKRAKKITDAGKSHKETVFIADRSPYSAVFYCGHGDLLKPVIDQQMSEVQQHAGIHIFTVHVHVQNEVLWQRVQARLELEPDRALYKEDQYEWMEQVAEFYNTFSWNLHVDNSEEDPTMTLERLLHRTTALICSTLPQVEPAFKAMAPELYVASLTTEQKALSDEEGVPSQQSARPPKDLAAAFPAFVAPESQSQSSQGLTELRRARAASCG